MRNSHKTKKISAGHYKYRGFDIICVGYYHPEHRVCWEAVEHDGISGFAHGYTLKEVKNLIDFDLEEEKEK